MVRNILAAIIGFVVAWIVITIMQLIGHYIWSVEPVDYNDAASFTRIIASMTPVQFVFLLLGYALGSLCAGLVIGKIAEAKGHLLPLIVGALMTGTWIWLNAVYPHPTWVMITGLFMYIPFTILGKNLTAGSGTVGTGAGMSSDVEEAEAGISDEVVEAGSGLSMDAPDVDGPEEKPED
ncbi:MAG TPA: hypothetical protein VMM38_02930 [Aridibacter sp.]|nr:hypothetical protein [Aridibacter sp.]